MRTAATRAGARLLVVAGCAAAWWSRPGHAAAGWWRAWRCHRLLGPLWEDLSGAFPEVRLAAPGLPPPLRLARRVVEIRDGLLRLAPWRRRRAVAVARRIAAAQRLDGRLGEAFVEAFVTADALAARERGNTPPTPGEHDPARADQPGAGAEVDWLCLLASVYQRSPAVRAARRGRLRPPADRRSPPEGPSDVDDAT